ncbi:hypothetical protein G3I77_16985 [Streptomyces sp. D2-8]|uniref:inorganic phosphate transporter n=1 Tax=Streptomyces sp. D2-8 TaxID=2707767 RepID=UPI0024A72BF0|nr:inorganic phosphate transporter [Streptomyces sp. D2-8]MCK8434654.1 hypothetical protein [Streptomyces sp. D2-8]
MDHITFLVIVIVTALAFDFTNGFHDTANAMATSIATGALAPRTAVLISGVRNVIGAFLSTEVARTISGGIVNDTLVSPGMIFAGLVGAILWNLLTWLAGLPSSSSHALFGGGVAGRMAVAWTVTLPAAALVGGLAAAVVRHGGDLGTAAVALVGVALAAGIVVISHRNPVHAHNVNDAREVSIRTEPPAKVGTAA